MAAVGGTQRGSSGMFNWKNYCTVTVAVTLLAIGVIGVVVGGLGLKGTIPMSKVSAKVILGLSSCHTALSGIVVGYFALLGCLCSRKYCSNTRQLPLTTVNIIVSFTINLGAHRFWIDIRVIVFHFLNREV